MASPIWRAVVFSGVSAMQQEPQSMRGKWGNLRQRFLRRGLALYRRFLKSNVLGRLIRRQIIRRGWVKPSGMIESLLLEEPNPIERIASDHIEANFAVPGFHLCPPLNLAVSDRLTTHPSINVLLPSLKRGQISGDTNTTLILAALLAERGERIRLIVCDAATDGGEPALFDHMDGLLRRPVARKRIELVDGVDRSRPIGIGLDDIFLATTWWTAQIAKYAVLKTVHTSFVYLIHEFEPILHEGGTFQARALETYGFDHIPVINSKLLFDHLIKEGAGRFADANFTSHALWFEPALDRRLFYPEKSVADKEKKKVLLFYARPSLAPRNLFEIGVVALKHVVASGHIDEATWEVWAIGEHIAPVDLGHGVFLKPLPGVQFDIYAKRVRTADLMLSLMLSPHPGEPPLEMAASGNPVVTNSFSLKSPQRLQQMSRNILVAQPNVDDVAATLGVAVGRINAGLPSSDPSGASPLPLDWDESLNGVVEQLLIRLTGLRSKRAALDRPVASGLPAEPETAYESFRSEALARRRLDGIYQQRSGLLTFVTSVYNTDPAFLDQLASCLLLQDGGTSFEWFILDNGSTSEGTKSTLKAIGRHAGVRIERIETNLTIAEGMRFCLDRAQGRYIVPLDSDDLIERDCVNVLTRFLEENRFPAWVYTDEDRLQGANFTAPFFKPQWDPVLFLHACYIAHLCVIDRSLAQQLLYIDGDADGGQGIGSFISLKRVMTAGVTPLHVPEALYSRRGHGRPPSFEGIQQSYITQLRSLTTQRPLDSRDGPEVLPQSSLNHRDVDDGERDQRSFRIAAETITINGDSRHESQDTRGTIRADGEHALQQLADRVAALSQETVHLIWDDIVPDTEQWLPESSGLLQLFSDAVMVGGILHAKGRIVDGPRIFGFGAGYDCPDRGRPIDDPGHSGMMSVARSVSAVSSGHCVIRRDFLLRTMPVLLRENVPLRMIGPWLGAMAAEQGCRIVFSPFMAARAVAAPEDRAPEEARARFLSRFWSQLPDTRFYSPRLGLTRETAYTPVTEASRMKHLAQLQCRTLPYAKWLERELRVRAARYPCPARMASITILTPVYSGSDLALLDELAWAIAAQTEPAHQWLLIVNGPMPEAALETVRARAAGDWKAGVIVAAEAIGIVSALRLGLEAAESEYVIPVDADDLITFDAIQILAHEIDRLARPDLLFSDEDVLIDGKPTAPYLRAAYDPLLSLDNSTIWHLCAMKRETALAAGVYSDPAANWCQDWDSVSRITGCGGRIEHVPEVLYHWRQHSGSTTNNATGDLRSLDSVRHILERHIARCARPEHFEVAEWPENRGAREMYMARRPDNLPPYIWMGDALRESTSTAADGAILVHAGNGVSINGPGVFVEVARLFELHPGLGIIGGKVINRDGFIVDSCYMVSPAGSLESPWMGRPATYAGPFSLALKTQSVALPGGALSFFRVAALQQAGLWPLPANVSAAHLVWQLCNRLIASDWTVGFSPLVRARVTTTVYRECTARLSAVLQVSPRHALVRYGRSCNFAL